MRKNMLWILLILLCLSVTALGEPVSLDDGSWYRNMWYTENGVSLLEHTEKDGVSCLYVQNLSENDARFSQAIDVEPDTLYCIHASVCAEGCPEDGIGATLSIENTFCYSESVYDTHGEWQDVYFYGQTGSEQTSLTLYLRVGGYSALTTGAAWFRNVTIEQVSSVPADALVQDFTPLNFGYAEEDTSAATTDENAEPKRATPTYVLLAGIYALIALAVLRRIKRRNPASPKAYAKLFAQMLVVGIVLRCIMAILVPGYYTDMNCFRVWSERIYNEGIVNFYSDDVFCDYPPGSMLLLLPMALLRRVFGIAAYSDAHTFLLKLLAIGFDVGMAILAYRVTRKYADDRAAAWIGSFIALNPAIMVDSAAWGQMDSVFTLFIALCALFAARKRYIPSLIYFAIAMLCKPQALLFAPLGLAVMIMDIAWQEKSLRPKLYKQFGISIAAALGTLYVVALPFCLGRGNGFFGSIFYPVSWLWNLYSTTMQGYECVVINALNLYDLLGLNWTSISSATDWTVFAWMLFALSHAYAIFLFWHGRDGKRIFLCGGILMVLIFTFGPMIHERYSFPAILLLALAYAFDRDRRLLISMITLTVTLALNEVLVLQGGMTAANYGHLQDSEQWINSIVCLANIANSLLLIWTGFDIVVLKHTQNLSQPEIDTISIGQHSLNAPDDYKLHLQRRDWIAMLSVTLVYSIVAFTNLGSLTAPQSGWMSTAKNERVTFDLGETKEFRMTYYGGICDTTFTVELSNDGENWTEPCYAQYDQGEIFRWIWFVPRDENLEIIYASGSSSGWDAPAETSSEAVSDGSATIRYAGYGESYPMQTARYVRITAQSAGLTLYEVGFLDADGNTLPATVSEHTGGTLNVVQSADALLDEQDIVEAYPSYYNSTYFDEIYHARTAFEHLHGLSTYEWTHPPLGKVLMMIGIAIFGMCPFGWRFMGALMGVLMLPILYLLVKRLTKSFKAALISMLLMALDSMHFTLTRIATIDSYAVFFILLMYLFMVQYAQMSWNKQPFRKTLVPLGLCGITMGCAWATKWTGIYASVGLAVILFWTLIRRYIEIKPLMRGKRNSHADGIFLQNTALTLGFCLIFFILIPAVIYYFSYYWQLRYEGGLSISRVLELQESMFNYHAGLGGDTHYFRSDWYQWPIIWWPMWFYSGSDFVSSDMISSISCMGNPAVFWFGLFALLYVTVRACWQRRATRRDIMLILGFASQYLPWVLVPRSTFIYHYFASVPFIIAASASVLEDWRSYWADKHELGQRVGTISALSVTALLLILCCALAITGAKAYVVFLFGVLAAALLLGWMCGKFGYFTAAQWTVLIAALILFVAFYPIESGYPVSRTFAQCLRWFQWYNY